MRLLLDTHTWLLMLGEPDRLPDSVRAIVGDSSNEVLLSAASTWEIGIKYELGKLDLPEPPASYVPSRLAVTNTRALPIEVAHTLRAANLPPHHRDPFDRLLIAQAQVLRVGLCSGDRAFGAYDVDVIWS